MFALSPNQSFKLHLRAYFEARDRGYPRLAAGVLNRIHRQFGVVISPRARLARSVRFAHPMNIVIGRGVVIGEDVTIYQGVTIGGARVGDAAAQSYPSIGDNTVLFAGSVIVGAISIGSNCIVGANAVVLSSVPDNSIAVGVPAVAKPRKAYPST